MSFLISLMECLDLCIEQLLERFEIQCRRKAKNYPFFNGAGSLA